MSEVETEEHLGYEKHSVTGDNSGNSRNGYNHKTIISDYGESETPIPRDHNGELEPKILGKRKSEPMKLSTRLWRCTRIAKGKCESSN